jgi:putative phage-type endonuclease
MVTVTTYNSRDEWITHRTGIGASDSGAICGFGFKSALKLWQEKTGVREPEDLSDNERVSFGNAIEEPMRSLYRTMFPQYQLDFTPYTVLRRDDTHDFMFFTPDGWLTERDTGRCGLWECKSATCISRKDWEKWQDKIPMGYFCQILHGMFVGDFEFADLFAILLNQDRDATIRRYHVERKDHIDDINWIVEQEEQFWRCVETGTNPGATLRF